MNNPAKIRLYVDAELHEGQDVSLSRDHAHYLHSVMRRSVSDQILLFNGHDGEWLASLSAISKRAAAATCIATTRSAQPLGDIQLLFAPVKRARTDMIVEKAVEMGVSQITPVFTQYTNAERVRLDRMQAIAIEACEQSRGFEPPRIDAPQKLDKVLDNWPEDRPLIFANERAASVNPLASLEKISQPLSILIGPEGGFSEVEESRIAAMDQAIAISLGPRILRAETAAIAAMALVQASSGDWS